MGMGSPSGLFFPGRSGSGAPWVARHRGAQHAAESREFGVQVLVAFGAHLFDVAQLQGVALRGRSS